MITFVDKNGHTVIVSTSGDVDAVNIMMRIFATIPDSEFISRPRRAAGVVWWLPSGSGN